MLIRGIQVELSVSYQLVKNAYLSIARLRPA
jgi:hypothetical protein